MSHQQNEELKKRIKRLEEEIIERMRNYMYQHSMSKSRRKDSVASRGSQTDSIHSKPEQSTSPTPQKQAFSSFYHQLISPHKLSFEGNQLSPCKPFEEKIDASLDWLQKLENKDQIFEQMAKKIITLCDENEVLRLNHQKMSKMLKEISSQELNGILERQSIKSQMKSEDESIQIEKLKQRIKQANNRFKIMEKAVLETEQIDYKLRLTIQSLQHQMKAKEQLMKEMKEGTARRQSELTSKIEQMEIIKKQYLRAYSKVKEEKEVLQHHIMEIKEGKTLNINFPLSSISEVEDEHIDEVIRSSSADNSLGVIKNFMERSLIESHRPSMEKWITVSISKLDQLENESQHKITDIHESYRNLLRQMADNFRNEMKVLQKQFEATINKVILSDIKHVKCRHEKEEEAKNLCEASGKRRASYSLTNSPALSEEEDYKGLYGNQLKSPKTFDCNDDILESEQFLERQRNWELLCKLSVSQAKCIGIQDKYDILVHKLSNSNVGLKESRIHREFKQMMEKLVNFHKAGHQAYELRVNFIQICQKVFEILGNLPTGSHGEIYFVPKDFQELNDALNVLLRFSQNYDKINEERVAQNNRKLEIIRKLVEEILGKKNVKCEQIEQLLRKSIEDQSVSVGQFMSKLMESLRKQHEERQLSIGGVVAFGHTSKISRQ